MNIPDTMPPEVDAISGASSSWGSFQKLAARCIDERWRYCAKYQRALTVAIKRVKHIALMPHVQD